MNASEASSATAQPTPPMGFPHAPAIRTVTGADILASLREGFADFKRAPLFGLFFGGVYAAGGLLLLACVSLWDTAWAIIPLAIAFPLIGPFVAVGLYEVSRRLSSGEKLSWGGVLGVVLRQRDRELAWIGFAMLFVFWMWAYQVRILLAIFLGSASFTSLSTLDGFLKLVMTTENGVMFILVGTAIGAFLALVLFSITVISVPLLLDRDVDFITAIVTSVTTVRRSPAPMIAWGLAVLILMLVALAPLFLGLLFVLPILGHATWRLYERAIVRPTAE
ncbi:MAG: DUF2189 domain-containing protein [Neomegalonema sp.]|nr:DUF2189 domain-containing protein [Neomegalonema sp.]